MALQDAAERPVDLRNLPWRLHQSGAASLRGQSVCARHPAHGRPQLCERPLIYKHRVSVCFFENQVQMYFDLGPCRPSGLPAGEQLHLSERQKHVGGVQTLHCPCECFFCVFSHFTFLTFENCLSEMQFCSFFFCHKSQHENHEITTVSGTLQTSTW